MTLSGTAQKPELTIIDQDEKHENKTIIHIEKLDSLQINSSHNNINSDVDDVSPSTTKDTKDTKEEKIRLVTIEPENDNNYLRLDVTKRHVLGDYMEEDRAALMNPAPSRLMVVTLYFFTIECDEDFYVLLDYTSYAPIKNSKGYTKNDGIWSVPHTTTYVEIGRRRLNTINEIMAEYDHVLGQEDFQEKLNILQEDLFYSLGLHNVGMTDMEPGRNYIEYKHTYTNPENMCCYYIREFFVKNVDKLGLLNLTDPECLHKHFYMPMYMMRLEAKNALVKEYEGLCNYRGRPMPENISEVLTSGDYINNISKYAIKVNSRQLVRKMKGILFKTAISDAHNIYKSFTNMKGLVEELIPEKLEEAMADMNIRYYLIDRDQIIGVMPDGEKDFTMMLEELYAIISSITSPSGHKLCLRCTALSCDFLYGKIFGLNTSRPGFDGDGYLKLCSMAQDTHRVQMAQYSEFNGIILGWDAKDDNIITFTSSGVIQISNSGVKKSKNNPGMKYKVLSKERLVEYPAPYQPPYSDIQMTNCEREQEIYKSFGGVKQFSELAKRDPIVNEIYKYGRLSRD